MLSLLVFAAFTTALAAPSGTITSRAPARCVARDDNGGALLSSSITSDGFVACNYQNAGHCEYFTPGGQFSSGSSVCPDSITPGSKRSIEAPKLSARAPARCVARDDNGGALLSSSITSDGFVACNYQNAGHCEYFTPGGQFSSGSSVCPDSITPGSKRSIEAPKLSARAPARCVARDDNGGALLSSSITSDGFVACNYQNAGHCEYFTPGGQFSSGRAFAQTQLRPEASVPLRHLSSALVPLRAAWQGTTTAAPF
ncbi:hypothetical protein C8R43DRAFT_1107491 [Mycena crocata]|nr:hypothetical protein C8R43DRAFT_1107491 [Mycena crocata]